MKSLDYIVHTLSGKNTVLTTIYYLKYAIIEDIFRVSNKFYINNQRIKPKESLHAKFFIAAVVSKSHIDSTHLMKEE